MKKEKQVKEKKVKAAKVEVALKKEKIKETKVVLEKSAKPVKEPKKGKKTSKNEDTGSVGFQVNNFTQKIVSLTKHLKSHAQDFDSRRGLLIMVGKRRRLLNYIKKNDPVEYEKNIKSLKLKA